MICTLCGNKMISRRMRKYPICESNIHYHICPECGARTEVTNSFDSNGIENIIEVIEDSSGEYRIIYDTDHNLCKRCQRKVKLKRSNHSFRDRICIVCGNEFTPVMSNQSICERDHYSICKICGGRRFISSKKDLNKYQGSYVSFNVVECDDNKCLIEYTGNLAETSCNICKHRDENTIKFMRDGKMSSYKTTCLERYGVDNAIKLDETEAKRVETYYKNYGVKHPMKVKNIAKDRGEKVSKSRLRGFAEGSILPSNKSNNTKGKHCNLIKDNKEIKFRSSWELFFAILLELERIDYSYESLRINYTTEDSKIHTYIPDFIVKNNIYEIKGVPKLDKNLEQKRAASEEDGYKFFLITDIKPIKEKLANKYDIDIGKIEKDIIDCSRNDKIYSYYLESQE